MQTFLRRLEILNFLSSRQRARVGPVGTEVIVRHLQDAGYLDSHSGQARSQFRLIQRDLNFLLGDQDEEGDFTNDFGLVMERGVSKSLLWSLQPYQQLSYDFERMPAYMALALSLSQKHLRQVLPQATQHELSQIFSSAQERLEVSERKLSAKHYVRLTKAVEFYQRGQSLRAPDFDMQWLDKIYQAILLGRRIEIEYASYTGTKHYSLDPYGVAIMLPKLYLVAKKVDQAASAHQGFRSFLLHKIKSIELSRFANQVPEDFNLKSYLEAGNMDVLIDSEDVQNYQLKLLLNLPADASLMQDLRDSPISSDQRITRHDDETWLLSATVKRTVQLRNWLISLGNQAKVLEPDIIVHDLLAHLQQQLNLYTS